MPPWPAVQQQQVTQLLTPLHSVDGHALGLPSRPTPIFAAPAGRAVVHMKQTALSRNRTVRMQGFVPIQQAPSMFLSSSFSIAAGCSLGPEAPLLGGCAFRFTVFACQHLAVCSRVKTHTPAEHVLSVHACPAALCAASTSWLGRAVLGAINLCHSTDGGRTQAGGR